MCVYDCTDEDSFANVNQWLEYIRQGARDKVPIMLVANKSDTEPGLRAVTTQQGEALARDSD